MPLVAVYNCYIDYRAGLRHLPGRLLDGEVHPVAHRDVNTLPSRETVVRSAGTPSPSLLKRLLKREREMQQNDRTLADGYVCTLSNQLRLCVVASF